MKENKEKSRRHLPNKEKMKWYWPSQLSPCRPSLSSLQSLLNLQASYMTSFSFSSSFSPRQTNIYTSEAAVFLSELFCIVKPTSSPHHLKTDVDRPSVVLSKLHQYIGICNIFSVQNIILIFSYVCSKIWLWVCSFFNTRVYLPACGSIHCAMTSRNFSSATLESSPPFSGSWMKKPSLGLGLQHGHQNTYQTILIKCMEITKTTGYME